MIPARLRGLGSVDLVRRLSLVHPTDGQYVRLDDVVWIGLVSREEYRDLRSRLVRGDQLVWSTTCHRARRLWLRPRARDDRTFYVNPDNTGAMTERVVAVLAREVANAACTSTVAISGTTELLSTAVTVARVVHPCISVVKDDT